MSVQTSKGTSADKRCKWNTDILKKYIKDNNIDVELLSEYVDAHTKMNFRCKCGEIFSTNLHEFNNKKFPKRQCNKCGRKKPNDKNKITINTIEKYLKDNNYTCKLLSNEYIDCDDKLEFLCQCGKIFYASWSNIKHMSGLCKNCAMKKQSHAGFLDRIHEYLTMFDIVSEYSGCNNNVDILCKKCNTIIRQTPYHIYERGIHCPCCNGSTGEQYISNYFNIHNINFIPQYKFEDCKNINPLPFDFYLPDFNTCIEFQGLQHYKPIEYFGGINAYKKLKIRDEIKKKYCLENNINFIEISYKDIKNIDSILNNIISDFKEVV